MFAKLVLTATVILFAASIASSQQERPAGENPGAVKVELTTLPVLPSDGTEPLESRESGSPISFQVLMTNTSAEKLLAVVYDPYYQSSPRLIRNGKVIPYRKEIAELVKQREEKQRERNLRFYRLYFYRVLEPGKPTAVNNLDLRDWYDPLVPGQYQLTTRYRFEGGAEWTPESSRVKFEVIP